MIAGKNAPSHNPTKNLKAYNSGTAFTDAQANVNTAYRISSVETKTLGRAFVDIMIAGSCPTAYPTVKIFPM
jgi:hypothetical protein